MRRILHLLILLTVVHTAITPVPNPVLARIHAQPAALGAAENLSSPCPHHQPTSIEQPESEEPTCDECPLAGHYGQGLIQTLPPLSRASAARVPATPVALSQWRAPPEPEPPRLPS